MGKHKEEEISRARSAARNEMLMASTKKVRRCATGSGFLATVAARLKENSLCHVVFPRGCLGEEGKDLFIGRLYACLEKGINLSLLPGRSPETSSFSLALISLYDSLDGSYLLLFVTNCFFFYFFTFI